MLLVDVIRAKRDGAALSAEQIEFFKMMQAIDPGSKIVKIELVAPSAEEAAKLNKPMEMPDGKTYKMPVKIYKQLVISTETKDASGSSKGQSKAPVAEVNGKLVVPVPVPAKAGPAAPKIIPGASKIPKKPA